MANNQTNVNPDPLHNLGMPINDVLAAKQRQMDELEKADDYLEKIEVDHPDVGIFRKSLLGFEHKRVVVGEFTPILPRFRLTVYRAGHFEGCE